MVQIVNAAGTAASALRIARRLGFLRAGEAFGLHVEDLDLAGGWIIVRRKVWNGEEVTVKTKRAIARSTSTRAPGDVDDAPRRAYSGPRVRDANRDSTLQVEGVWQTEPEPQEACPRIWRATCLPAAAGFPPFGQAVFRMIWCSSGSAAPICEPRRGTLISRGHFRSGLQCDVAWFAQGSAFEKLPVGFNGPDSEHFSDASKIT